jgi:signal transduction histidine kinase/CheY-like chemotaxis protein
MRKILIPVYSALLVILVVNYFYYKNLYNNQIAYIVNLLDKQAQTVGRTVDSVNTWFPSDLNQIVFKEDLSQFFTKPASQLPTVERMKLFFSKYKDLVTGIKYYDNNRNEFTLKSNENGEWLEQPFVLHSQSKIYKEETLIEENHRYSYSLPVLSNSETIGNLVVSLDFTRFFKSLFTGFNLKDYQWQWVMLNDGSILYDNNKIRSEYSDLIKIEKSLEEGLASNIIHSINVKGKKTQIASSFYSTQLFKKDIGIIFSTPTAFFQKYLIIHSVFIVLFTLLLVQLIIIILWRQLKREKVRTDSLESSEKMLHKLIEEMPVGVIVLNRNREVLKANKVAAAQYSYASESEMKGMIFPESAVTPESDYYSRDLGGKLNPGNFVIIKKENGDLVLYRYSIPVNFKGEDGTMEILLDVTMLESARKEEARANEAKSEFLARMSYEIRTPLNGIIGMTDILIKNHLSPEIQQTVSLLRQSGEVLLNIINDILDFSKIESGKMILDEMPFNLREEIAYCIGLANTGISQDLELTSKITDNVPENIIGDPYRLRQIITNLLNHSISNTESGKIHLGCYMKEIKHGVITLEFDISDTGRSFDALSLKKIFGDLINIEARRIKSNDDPDFGTILSRQLVELMGGRLTAISPSGLSGELGTKVTFTIKTHSNDRQIKELSFEDLKTVDKIKTLVITGNHTRDEEVLGLLHRLGLTITVTTFQRSTISQIKANMGFPAEQYRLVVIIEDEDFDGFTAASAIHESGLSSHFIMLMISSNDRKGNYMNCASFGIDHYLVKPFDITELMTIIKSSFPFLEETTGTEESSAVRTDINILIIEDNKMNQNVIGMLLRSLGFNYEVADDGWAGYQRAKEKKFDLIFMDLIMPEMDGFESSQRILKVDNSVIIVAFTADNLPETRRKAELSGIKDFVSKPVRIDELKRLFVKYFHEN